MSSPATVVPLDRLRRLLVAIRREARGWIWIESLALVAVAAATLGGILSVIDWLLEPPGWARGIASAVAAGLLVWLLAVRLVGRLSAPLPDASLARAVERHHPTFGDTLSTAVELAAVDRADVDPELVARIAAAAEAMAATARPADVFRRRRLSGTALAGFLALAAVGGIAATWPELATIWGRRMVLLQDVAWPRRVQLEAEGFKEGIRKVARGSDVDVVVRAQARGPLPESVFLRSYGPGGWQRVRMGTRGGSKGDEQFFGHVLERVMTDTPLEIRGGDRRLRGLLLQVIEPPALAELTVQIRLPEYLGGGSRSLPALRAVPVPRGSRVDLRFQATKPLAAASVTTRFATDEKADAAGRVISEFSSATASATTRESPPRRDAISAEIASLDTDTSLSVAFTDHDGIANREPVTLMLSAVPDERPEVAMRLADVSAMVTAQARLQITGVISDDHGLASAAISVTRGEQDLLMPVPQVAGGEVLVELPVTAPVVVSLAPLALGVGDRFGVTVTATDACGLAGGPNRGTSDTWTLEVVSADSLRAMLEAREILLRRRYEAAIEDLAQARRSLEAGSGIAPAPAADRVGESAARGAGESQEIALAFQGIRAELEHNALLTPEVETRLVTQVAEPIAAVAVKDLAGVQTTARSVSSSDLAMSSIAQAELGRRTDAALEQMRATLARMLELESYNQVIEKLRGVIESQEQLRNETLERQRRRARAALEAP